MKFNKRSKHIRAGRHTKKISKRRHLNQRRTMKIGGNYNKALNKSIEGVSYNNNSPPYVIFPGGVTTLSEYKNMKEKESADF